MSVCYEKRALYKSGIITMILISKIFATFSFHANDNQAVVTGHHPPNINLNNNDLLLNSLANFL